MLDSFFQKAETEKQQLVRAQNVLSEAVVPLGFPQSFRSFVGHEGKVDSSD
jgi:hypothetical protein